jgi:DNA invertase Pin-like site-specific DNA recombinase
MKGTMSELELSLFRQRSQEALKQKARRGGLFLGVAASYVRAGRDRIEKDPDQRVQEALSLVFTNWRCRRHTSRRRTPGDNMMLLTPPTAWLLAS